MRAPGLSPDHREGKAIGTGSGIKWPCFSLATRSARLFSGIAFSIFLFLPPADGEIGKLSRQHEQVIPPAYCATAAVAHGSTWRTIRRHKSKDFEQKDAKSAKMKTGSYLPTFALFVSFCSNTFRILKELRHGLIRQIVGSVVFWQGLSGQWLDMADHSTVQKQGSVFVLPESR